MATLSLVKARYLSLFYFYLFFVVCRALPSLESNNEVIANFTHRDNGRRITDIISDQFIKSDFPFIGVSVSQLCVIACYFDTHHLPFR